jgi:hypothetical protein
MKKIYTLILLLSGLFGKLFSQTTDLLISEYGEGSSGNSKYIELYNGTGSSINLSDYRIWTISNGGSWPEGSITLSGTLATGVTYVIANNATDVPGANQYTGSCNWNGDDAVGLAKNIASVWTLIDVVGTDGADPGSGWPVAGTANGTVDKRLTRKASICSPTTDWTVSAGTTTANSQWTITTSYTSGAANAGHSAPCSGATSEIQLQQPAGIDSACGFIYDYGTYIIGNSSDVTIQLKNLGTGSLTIDSTVISGTNAAEFSVFSAPSSSVAAGDSTTMIIRFTAGLPGTKTAFLTIYSDDANESACTINLSANATYASCTELIISEYGEPLTGNGKYIEIYNGTPSSINLANYELWSVLNGGTWPENILSLSGTLSSGSTYVVANNSADVPTADFYDATFCNWNGDDAVGLAKLVGASFYLIDAVGTDGADPGAGWSVAGVSNATSDQTLVRKTSIDRPTTNWTNSAGTTNVNTEWFVRPYQLTSIGCNINSCLTSSTIGFTVSTATVTESNTTVTINITMPTAPSSTVNAIISDALLGTASSGTDYSAFSPTSLSFSPIEVYPNTKSVTITISDDAISESNENIVLSIDAQCGALISNGTYSLTIIDNEIPEGLVINEFSQGSFSKEYIELVVTGTPGTTIDLRGWIVDDNSGIFSGGYGTQMGIADGHLKFSDICTWEKVPVGSIILIYNSSDKNTKITMVDDPTDADLDYLYVVGIESAPTTCASMAIANLYFSSDCIKPNNASYDQYTPPVYTNVDWGTIEFRNGGDATQVRSPSGGFFHGLSYGSKGSGSDCSICAITQANHPDYAVYGSNALYFSGTTQRTFSFQNTNDNDYRKQNNWTSTTTTPPNTLETPGDFNNANNQTWILSLRSPFGVVLDNQSYTCNLRAFESRLYLDGIDSIIYWIKNNISTDHGAFTAQTILHDDASAGIGFQNTNLTGTPLFMRKTFAASPSTASPANYKIRFYVTTQELQDYCDYINPILNAIPGYSTVHNHTPGTVINHLKIYRTNTTDRAWTVTSDAQVQIVTPTIGTYGDYTTFEYDGFSAFSGYALGDIVTPFIGLPVELIAFSANCKDDIVTINWTTASELNSAYFELERSSDAIHFSPVTKIETGANSTQLKNYSYADLYPLNGINYYRLKQQDIGNTAPVYSTIIQTACDEFSTNTSSVFYTADNSFHVHLTAETTKHLSFSLYEISGKLLYQETKTIGAGTTDFALNFRHTLASGVYVLQMIDVHKIISKKIVVP